VFGGFFWRMAVGGFFGGWQVAVQKMRKKQYDAKQSDAKQSMLNTARQKMKNQLPQYRANKKRQNDALQCACFDWFAIESNDARIGNVHATLMLPRWSWRFD